MFLSRSPLLLKMFALFYHLQDTGMGQWTETPLWCLCMVWLTTEY